MIMTKHAMTSLQPDTWLLKENATTIFVTSVTTGSRGVTFVRKNYPSYMLPCKIHNLVILINKFAQCNLCESNLKFAINRRPFFRGRLRAHSNLTCGKNKGNASNASSQRLSFARKTKRSARTSLLWTL